MKRILTVLLAIAMILSLTLTVSAEDHEHAFADGICECGKYEAAFITRVPIKDKYKEEVEEKGTLETLTYPTHAYGIKGSEDAEIEKTLQVYLPYGYDPANQYNVVYIMHGGGDSEYYWFNDEPVYEGSMVFGRSTKLVLNKMLHDGKIEPTIFVAPTYVTKHDGKEISDFEGFEKELRNDIIPFIEAKYATYASGDVSEENLIATRAHRAFCGYSMGSICTLQSAMMRNLDYIGYFGAFSGAKTDIDAFKEAIEGFGLDVFYMYNGNGTNDIAHDEHEKFAADILKKMPETFRNGKNFAWIDFKGGSHAYNCWLVDLYNCMLVFFR